MTHLLRGLVDPDHLLGAMHFPDAVLQRAVELLGCRRGGEVDERVAEVGLFPSTDQHTSSSSFMNSITIVVIGFKKKRSTTAQISDGGANNKIRYYRLPVYHQHISLGLFSW
jgi:hypothetical protein